VRIDGVALSERMIARENHDERLFCYQLVFKIGRLFPAEKSDIKSSALEVVCKRVEWSLETLISTNGLPCPELVQNGHIDAKLALAARGREERRRRARQPSHRRPGRDPSRSERAGGDTGSAATARSLAAR
jgi:hypothetical protein